MHHFMYPTDLEFTVCLLWSSSFSNSYLVPNSHFMTLRSVKMIKHLKRFDDQYVYHTIKTSVNETDRIL